MNININGTDHELYFGLDFIAHLDERCKVKVGDVELGNGIYNARTQLLVGNPLILIDLIQAATTTNQKKPSVDDIKKYIEAEADIEKLVNDFLAAFETASVPRYMLRNLETAVEKPKNPTKK